MFKQLSQRLHQTVRQLTGQAQLTDRNLTPALASMREALVDADVALPVIDALLADVRERALGESVVGSLTPDQVLTRCVHDALVERLGGSDASSWPLTGPKPHVVLVAGLQGAGKTTSVAKLGRWLQTHHQQRVMVVSVDVYRPAAIEQLRRLAEQAELTWVPSTVEDDPQAIVARARDAAVRAGADVLLIDTAGRLHVDDAMMHEVQALHGLAKPQATLFVVDGMTGQDAAYTAEAFGRVLPLTGVVLTKTDGDSRGGAALSVRHVTGRPIQFMGTGEGLDAWDTFEPTRVADRMLDRGDVVALVKKVEASVDEAEAQRVLKNVQSGRFNLDDFRSQLVQMRNMGGMQSMLAMMPGANQLPQDALDQMDDRVFHRMEAMLNAMTQHERKVPDVLIAPKASARRASLGRRTGRRRRQASPEPGQRCAATSRVQRIARGSGSSVADVEQLLKQFGQMQQAMKWMKKQGGLMNLMGRMGGFGGGR